MLDLTKSLALVLALGLAAPALAQDTATPAQTEQTPAEEPANPNALSMGEEESAVGQTYTKESFDEWQVRCVRTEDGKDPCQLYQLLKDQAGNSVAEISMFGLPEGQQAAAGATIVTPLETLLTQQVGLQIDAAAPKKYPFTWCAPIGCFARVGFTAAEVDAFKKGNKATVTIVPVGAADQKVELAISLKGFTAGYDAVNEANKDLPPAQ